MKNALCLWVGFVFGAMFQAVDEHIVQAAIWLVLVAIGVVLAREKNHSRNEAQKPLPELADEIGIRVFQQRLGDGNNPNVSRWKITLTRELPEFCHEFIERTYAEAEQKAKSYLEGLNENR